MDYKSIYYLAYLGTAPFGSLIAGALSGRIGVPWTIAVGGGCCSVGALWFAGGLKSFQRTIRPIYIDLGLVTETQVAEAEMVARIVACATCQQHKLRLLLPVVRRIADEIFYGLRRFIAEAELVINIFHLDNGHAQALTLPLRHQRL